MNNTAVVVITCKRFKRLWEPFFALFDKYWSDCPFNIYLISDFDRFENNKVISIEVAQDLGFSSNLLFGLNKIYEENIIYFQEDYLFIDHFSTDRIEKYIEHMVNYNVSCLRLAPCPGPTAPWTHADDLGILQKGDPYRISTQTAIWKKEYLKSMLVRGQTGGQFETNGTLRSYIRNEILLSVWRGQTPTPYYITAVVRGIWQDGALELLKKEGLSLEHIQKVIP